MTNVIDKGSDSMIALIKEFKKHKIKDAVRGCALNGKNLRILENEGKIKRVKEGFLDDAYIIRYKWIGDK